eukprot:1159867-Pelagomonas_calceolata.AAC.6
MGIHGDGGKASQLPTSMHILCFAKASQIPTPPGTMAEASTQPSPGPKHHTSNLFLPFTEASPPSLLSLYVQASQVPP